jgi:hypothetical protein
MEQYVYNRETSGSDWPRWIKRFEIFLTIQEIDHTQDGNSAKCLARLLHSAGEKVFDLYLAEENPTATKYNTFKTKLTTFFTTTNDTMKAFQFNLCKPNQDENITDFITRVKILAKAANIETDNIDKQTLHVIARNYNNYEVQSKCLEDEMTLDKLSKWKVSQEIKESVLNMIKPKLSNDIFAIKSSEKYDNFNRRQPAQDESSSYTFNKHNAFNRRQPAQTESSSNRPPSSSIPQSKRCFFCGLDYPHKNKCPAEGKECNRCHKLNHFGAMCMKSKSKFQPQQQYRDNTNQLRFQDSTNHQSEKSDINRIEIQESDLDQLFETWLKERTATGTNEPTEDH